VPLTLITAQAECSAAVNLPHLLVRSFSQLGLMALTNWSLTVLLCDQ
jgi:hypothetical protein